MLEFLSIDVPVQLQSCWTQIYCTTKRILTNNGISLNDIDQIYQFIRTSVHLVITDNYCTSPYYAQIKLNEDDRKTITITLSGRLLQSDSYSVRIIDHFFLQRPNLSKRKCSS
jgi:hypothetical protein